MYSICVYAQSCLTLCDPMDCSPPGSSVHGILQARILDWVAISPPGVFLTQGSNLSLLCLLYWQADSLPLRREAPGTNGSCQPLTVEWLISQKDTFTRTQGRKECFLSVLF